MMRTLLPLVQQQEVLLLCGLLQLQLHVLMTWLRRCDELQCNSSWGDVPPGKAMYYVSTAFDDSTGARRLVFLRFKQEFQELFGDPTKRGWVICHDMQGPPTH